VAPGLLGSQRLSLAAYVTVDGGSRAGRPPPGVLKLRTLTRSLVVLLACLHVPQRLGHPLGCRRAIVGIRPIQDSTSLVCARVLLVLSLLGLLALGTWFRFYQLDRKVYWHDEVYTSLRIAGYTRREVGSERRTLNRDGWKKYQQVDPGRGLSAVIRALIDDVHPPLYFLVAREWAVWFGSSVWVLRSLSAAAGLLVWPCLLWLCRELFEPSAVGWIAVALMAVSPFHVLYAQEARQYSLWTMAILLSSAALLRALRLGSPAAWLLYTLTAAMALYTHYLSVVLIVGHGLYVTAMEGLRPRRSVVTFALAGGAAVLSFLPWLAVADRIGGAAFTRWRIPSDVWAQRWLMNLSSIFFDPEVGRRDMLFDVVSGRDVKIAYDTGWTYVSVIVIALVCYAVYVLYREAPRRTRLFISFLMGTITLFLVVPDVVSGEQRSTIGRYLIPLPGGPFLRALERAKEYRLRPVFEQAKLWQLERIKD
jgi:uncharacterized membrane protein